MSRVKNGILYDADTHEIPKNSWLNFHFTQFDEPKQVFYGGAITLYCMWMEKVVITVMVTKPGLLPNGCTRRRKREKRFLTGLLDTRRRVRMERLGWARQGKIWGYGRNMIECTDFSSTKQA
jgi:hypothetical protein